MRNEFLVPVLTGRQQKVFQLLVLLWCVTLCGFWFWWLRTEHVITWVGMCLNSLMVGFTSFIPGYFFFFALRMRKFNPAIAIPDDWKVAMVVTKAPSEPWPVVRETLEAMLSQSRPHDTWLADEDPSEDTLAWCQRHGVLVSCRKGISDYHRSIWPRRTRCKEGNLAYFYDTYGYRHYDIVVQMDADHVPAPGYLEAMIRPFMNPEVGYVAAPSICDANAAESWVVNGRLFAEATLHGPLQAGYTDGWAPLCIGSHYAVRTVALKDIGGLGPELAEDHTTTLMMNAGGWRGVFAFDAEARGFGPSCFADAMTQEYQWSRSLTTVLLAITPKYWRGLPARLKFQFLFAQIWYPLFGLSGLIGMILPIIALVIDRPWLKMSYFEFLGYSFLLGLTALFPVLWLKRCGCLRPKTARVISWQSILFHLARGPWIIAGVSHGVIGWLRRKELEFRITPKGDRQVKPLPLPVVLPYLLLGLFSALVVIAIGGLKWAKGYYFLTLVQATYYVGTFAAIVFLHLRENPGSRSLFRVHRGLVAFGLGILLLSAGLKLPLGVEAIGNDRALQTVREVIGDLSARLAPGEWSSADILDRSEPAIGVYDPAGGFQNVKSIQIEHHFVPWRLDNANELIDALAKTKQAKRFPMITLEPWSWNWNGMVDRTLLTDIAAGKYDATLTRAFQVLKEQSPQKVLFRFGHEMEKVDQYPWSKADYNAYIAAYRHAFELSRELGVNNLLWVWSPAGNRESARYWPGEEYVDYIGVSIYATPEWNKTHPEQEILTFEQLMREKYWFVDRYPRPILATEVGVNASDAEKKRWLVEAIEALPKFPRLKAWVYFNQIQPAIVPVDFPGQPDWELSTEQIDRLSRALERR
ncbi:glycosyltransferase family 2 protein [Pannus brasiliensis CCIBt3594]|uniref:Glycosyltransferase family 2 protein n=1 Tax=Pannus brasiliensis CCIBt3594 TaxID=1427578 RepID=A0AAW9QQP3_9CHRO